MNVGTTITLENGHDHEIKFGDVLKFNFQPLMDSPFSNSYFGRSITEKEPEEITFHIIKGEFDLFRVEVDYFKNGEKIDNFAFSDPAFFSYICSKNSFSFIKNETKNYEKKLELSLSFGDLFITDFNNFEQANYLKEEYLDILKTKNTTHIAIHFFNAKDVMPNYVNALEAKIYAFNQQGFQNLETKEELEENIEYYKERGRMYKPDLHIIDYDFRGISIDNINFLNKKDLLKNKIDNILVTELTFDAIKHHIDTTPHKKFKIKP